MPEPQAEPSVRPPETTRIGLRDRFSSLRGVFAPGFQEENSESVDQLDSPGSPRYDWDWLDPSSEHADPFIIKYLEDNPFDPDTGRVESIEKVIADEGLSEVYATARNFVQEARETPVERRTINGLIVASINPDSVQLYMSDHKMSWLCTKKYWSFQISDHSFCSTRTRWVL